MLFIPAFAEVVSDTLTPSEVRRHLASARGAASPLLREQDGTDRRTSVPFAVRQSIFSALAGEEALAGREVIAALHAGDLRSFTVDDDGAIWRIAPMYWEPRHDAADRAIISGTALFWGEDQISNHPDRPVQEAYVGCMVLVGRADALEWLAAQPGIQHPLPEEERQQNLKPFTRSTPTAEVDAWYRDRIRQAPPAGYKREEDEAVGKAVGLGRDRVRDARRLLAPSHWHADGPKRRGA